jgi:hypothetical protein
MISIGCACEKQQSAWQHSSSDKTWAEAVARLRDVRVVHCGGTVLRTVGVAGDLDSTAPVFLAVGCAKLKFNRAQRSFAGSRDAHPRGMRRKALRRTKVRAMGVQLPCAFHCLGQGFWVGTGHAESQNIMDPLNLTGGGREIVLQLRDRALARYCNGKSCS